MRSFPYKKEEITKQIITSKLKGIRLNIRKAVDSGRNGHGRVVMTFFELCVTEQLNGGIESVYLVGKDSSASSEGNKNANTSLEGGDTSVNMDNSSINNASFQVSNNDGDRDTYHTEEPDHSEAHTDGSEETTIKQIREFFIG
jgi:hypothetical protein